MKRIQKIWEYLRHRGQRQLPWAIEIRDAAIHHSTLPWFWVLRAADQIEEPVQVRCTACAVFLEVGSALHWQKILSTVKRYRNNSYVQGVIVVTPTPWLMQSMDWRTPLEFLKCLRRSWEMMIPITMLFTHLEYFPGSADQLGGEVQGEIGSWISSEEQRAYQHAVANVSSGKDLAEKMSFLFFTEKVHVLFEAIKTACATLSSAALPWAAVYCVRGGHIITPPLAREIFPTPEKKRRHNYLRWVWAVMFALCAVSFIPVFQQAYIKNQALLEKAQISSHQLLTTLVREGRTSNEVAKALVQSFSDYDALMRFKQESAFWDRFGFYLGDKVRKPLEEIHLRVLRTFFMPMVGKAIEQRLAEMAMQWSVPGNRSALRGDYYRLLKTYLMICFPHQLEVSDALSVLVPLWQRAWAAQGVIVDRGGDSLTSFQLIPPAAFYLEKLSHEALAEHSLAWTLDLHLVETARAALRTPFNIYNLYADLKSHGLSSLGTAFFTAKAWRQWVTPAIKKMSAQGEVHDWITETALSQLSLPRAQVVLRAHQKSVETLRQGLISAYLQDYVGAWWETVSRLRLQQKASLTEVSRALEQWADPKGSFAKLVKKITENFEPSEIARAYPTLSSFSIKDPQLKSYFALLSKIQIELETLALSADPARDAAVFTRRLLAGEATDSALYRASFVVEQRVKMIASPMEQAIMRHLLLMPLKAVWHVLLHETTLYIDPLWQAQVYQPYMKTVLSKFPFSESDREASVEEMKEWLRPVEGRMTKFVQEILQPFLVQDVHGWQPRQWLGEGLAFSPIFLEGLAAQEMLGRALNVVWQFYPEPHPGMSQMSFQIGSQRVRYYNGPQEWMSLHWPGKHPEWGAELAAHGRGNHAGTLTYKGEWGMVRLLRASHLTPLPGGAYRVVCTLFTFRVRTAGENFIPLLTSHRLMLPEKVFNEDVLPVRLHHESI